MTEDRDSPSAKARAVAEQLVPVFAEFESICLDVGSRLGDAVPGLAALAQTFGSLSEGLEGRAMSAASVDLTQIASQLTRASSLLEEEERAMQSLLKLNQTIERQVRGLQVFVRTVATLVFTLKIEAAQLPQQSADMVEFAKTLQDLAEQTRTSLEDYYATQERLAATLRCSAVRQAEFKRKHQAELASIATDISDGLEALAERRHQAAIGLQNVARRSRDIGERIGECVVGLQIGDSTRQRVENVAAGLTLAADTLAGAWRHKSIALFRGDKERLAARIAELQRRQVEGARADFVGQVEKIAKSLGQLVIDASELEDHGLRLFGGGEDVDDSFLQALGRKLAQGRALVKEGIETRASVDAAKAAVAETMDDLQSRTVALVEMAADVTMIGTNASLRSGRLGDAGRGVTLIASELRGFGRQIRGAVEQLPPALARVIAFVDRFAAAQSELDAMGLARLDERMRAAIDIFDRSGREMTEALAKLGVQTAQTHERLGLANRSLGRQNDAAPKLEDAAGAIAGLVASLGGGSETSAEIDRFLDETIAPTYSMAAQRRIHATMTGAELGAGDAAAASAPAEADVFML